MKKLTVIFGGILLLALVSANGQASEQLDFEVIKTYVGDAECIIAEDFDQDGYSDILFTGIRYGTKLMYGKPNLEFEEPITLTSLHQGILNTGYLNNDTLIDFILRFDNSAQIWINNGNRDYDVNILSIGNQNLGGVAIGFFNDDAYPDLAIAPNHIFFGDGTGNFPTSVNFPEDFMTAYATDLNNDGLDDLVTVSKMWINEGNGSFKKTASIPITQLTLQITNNSPFADFNHDGNADFAFITPHIGPMCNSMITVGFGNGSGGVLRTDTIRVLGTSYSMGITDANRDNNLDIAVSDATNEQLILYFGDGAGNFDIIESISYVTDSVMHAMSIGDIDRDGNPDFVSGSFEQDSITLLINTLNDQEILSNSMITTGYSNVNLNIENPSSFTASRLNNTIAGAKYRVLDIDQDSRVDDQVVDHNLQYGEYKITINRKPNVEPDELFSASINIGDEEYIIFKDYPVPGPEKSDCLEFIFDYEPVSPISPCNGMISETSRPTFDWSGLNLAGSEFTFQLDDNINFSSPSIIATVSSTTFTPTYELETDKVYYWRIIPTPSGTDEPTDAFAVYISPKPTDVADDDSGLLPNGFKLSQNYPNPFNPSTAFMLTLPKKADIEISIYNMLGQKVKTLFEGNLSAGEHHFGWNGTDDDGQILSAGTYLYRVKSAEFTETKKMMFLK